MSIARDGLTIIDEEQSDNKTYFTLNNSYPTKLSTTSAFCGQISNPSKNRGVDSQNAFDAILNFKASPKKEMSKSFDDAEESSNELYAVFEPNPNGTTNPEVRVSFLFHDSIDQLSDSGEIEKNCEKGGEENIIEEYSEVEKTYNEKLTRETILFSNSTFALYRNDFHTDCGACSIF